VEKTLLSRSSKEVRALLRALPEKNRTWTLKKKKETNTGRKRRERTDFHPSEGGIGAEPREKKTRQRGPFTL